MEIDDIKANVQELLTPLAEDQGALIDGVEYRANAKPPVLTIAVVRTDATESLSSDQLADLTRLFSKKLDEVDPIEGEYTLEVSTPGVEAPIVREDQWRRAIGKTVLVTRSDRHKLQGELLNVGADSIELRVEGQTESIPFSKITAAHGVAVTPREG